MKGHECMKNRIQILQCRTGQLIGSLSLSFYQIEMLIDELTSAHVNAEGDEVRLNIYEQGHLTRSIKTIKTDHINQLLMSA
ncbi:hypothetical protein [Vibrio sp. 10N.261.51.F12]|uniref:hypothetical protein n=1 Tax=Vibrio sp. 10N.261.51.F12 TaxID=3229679 RepID=UPI00354F6FD4